MPEISRFLGIVVLMYFSEHNPPHIHVRYNEHQAGIVDLGELIAGSPSASSLHDPACFARFHLDSWPTLAWPCGFDVAPETLYQMLTGKQPAWMSAISDT